VDELTLTLTLAALLGSTVSGIIGMAGGALLLGLMLIFGLDPWIAVPVHAVVQLVSNSTRVVAHFPNVRWQPFRTFILWSLPGPIIGLWLLGQIDSQSIKAIIGFLILYAVWAPKWGLERLSERQAFGLAGMMGGTLGVVVGAVGPLIAPFFLRGGFHKTQIIATKAVCQAFLHVVKIIAFAGLYPAVLGTTYESFPYADHLMLIAPMAAATIIGTYVGKWALRFISEKRFVMLYRVVLSALAARLIWSVFA